MWLDEVLIHSRSIISALWLAEPWFGGKLSCEITLFKATRLLWQKQSFYLTVAGSWSSTAAVIGWFVYQWYDFCKSNPTLWNTQSHKSTQTNQSIDGSCSSASPVLCEVKLLFLSKESGVFEDSVGRYNSFSSRFKWAVWWKGGVVKV